MTARPADGNDPDDPAEILSVLPVKCHRQFITGYHDALQGQAGTSDPVDATVVLLAGPGDRILTSDPGGIARLAAATGSRAVIITC